MEVSIDIIANDRKRKQMMPPTWKKHSLFWSGKELSLFSNINLGRRKKVEGLNAFLTRLPNTYILRVDQ
ncbi:hypothetical protein JTE90_029392 [Oedothorax gibbosus]|uniref:Uncharacterized protein n=1 Tax=Oedothorax gibbosus TaxID=931172 RepID=A0AAV6VP08_9ARAC|nr:hypothetical protein JTE90_029392 [Oedothorax gibbosus]